MSLRARLWLVLAALFLLPLVVGGLVLAVVVPNARSGQAEDAAAAAAAVASAEVSDRCRLLGLAAVAAGAEAAADPQRALDRLFESQYVDYAALLGPDGTVVSAQGELPPGAPPPADLPSCSRDQGGLVLADRVETSGPEGVATTVAALDLQTVVGVISDRTVPEGRVVLVHDDGVAAESGDTDLARQLARLATRDSELRNGGTTEVDGWTVAAQRVPGLPYVAVVALPDVEDGLRTMPLVLIVVATALAAGLLVGAVARDLSRPFAELTEAAERVAHGDLDTSVRTGEEGEAGRLGSALNLMIDELRRSLHDVERSRQELRDSLERIGDTLTATHDLDGLLQVVLDTAQATVSGTAGVVLHRTGNQLELIAEQGLYESGYSAPAVVRPGDGVLGRVASTGRAVRGRLGSGPPELEPAPGEPGEGEVLAVPLRSMGAVIGVLAVYRLVGQRAFDPTDEDALGTLAGQASIAIENVQLHREAQRLSTTDPLTGVWNFRYLSMSLAREIERSTRFDRPLAVLMLDLDHFKAVNDTYGHARGDAVLRELAERVQEQIREVDTFARYGGEEFVVVLPETTIAGAAQLADRICTAVRREPFHSDGEEPLDITVSIGGAAFPEHGSTPATLMRAADKALYVAKAEGRDRWHVPEVARD